MKAMRNNMVVLAVVTVLTLALFVSPSQAQEKQYLWTAQEVGTFIMMATTTLSEISKRYLPKDVQVGGLP